MSRLPHKLSQTDFQRYVEPHLSKAKRGFVCSIPLVKVFNYILHKLYTGCQWHMIPMDPHPDDPDKKGLSHDAVYHHFRKWSRDGSLETVFEQSISLNRDQLDLSVLNLDGSHTLAKKGGEAVAYQARKKAKTTNIIALSDQSGFVLSCTEAVSGNHHDSYELDENLKQMFKEIKAHGLTVQGTYLNGDSAFDSRSARKICFNRGVVPNIKANKRNQQKPRRGRKRLFDEVVYRLRAGAERVFSWVDVYRTLLVRFERRKDHWMGWHYLAFALVNLRHLIH